MKSDGQETASGLNQKYCAEQGVLPAYALRAALKLAENEADRLSKLIHDAEHNRDSLLMQIEKTQSALKFYRASRDDCTALVRSLQESTISLARA